MNIIFKCYYTRHILKDFHLSFNNILDIFPFFYVHKKKLLDSRKFSKSGFRWIHMLWDVLLTIWTFLENFCLSICLSVCLSLCMHPKFCEDCISRTNARKLMKHYIQLHFDIIWCWLNLGAYHSRSTEIFRKNSSKYANLMVESHICNNLNQTYRFFSFLIKRFLNSFS